MMTEWSGQFAGPMAGAVGHAHPGEQFVGAVPHGRARQAAIDQRQRDVFPRLQARCPAARPPATECPDSEQLDRQRAAGGDRNALSIVGRATLCPADVVVADNCKHDTCEVTALLLACVLIAGCAEMVTDSEQAPSGRGRPAPEPDPEPETPEEKATRCAQRVPEWLDQCGKPQDRQPPYMVDLDLSGCDLTAATLTYADLRWADLSGAILSDANLVYAKLEGANLSRANLNHAALNGANLTDATLEEATLGGANLT